jgi:hypothetical protein
MIQDGRRLPDARRTPQIAGVLKWWVRGRAQLDEFDLSVKGVDDALEALLIPLLVSNRVACTHSAALDDDATVGPGGTTPFLIRQSEVWRD